MTELQTALETELKLVQQLIDLLDKRSDRGILVIPENLQTEEDFTEELVAALKTPIMATPPSDTSISPFIIKGPESLAREGIDFTGDQAFLYGLFDRANRLMQRIGALEELDKDSKPLV